MRINYLALSSVFIASCGDSNIGASGNLIVDEGSDVKVLLGPNSFYNGLPVPKLFANSKTTLDFAEASAWQ